MAEAVIKPTMEELEQELEENGREVTENVLKLDTNLAVPGDTIGLSGSFDVPNLDLGTYDVKLQVAGKEVASASFQVKEIPDILKQSDIRKAYESAFAEVLSKDAWKFADSKYKPGTQGPIKAQLKKYNIQEQKYTRQFFDCDDFTIAAHGVLHLDRETAAMAVFETWVQWEARGNTYGHAVISFTDGVHVIVEEPQQLRFFSVPEKWKLWLLEG